MRGPRGRLKPVLSFRTTRDRGRGAHENSFCFCLQHWRADTAHPRIAQDSVAQFYKGRQITVVVGSSPGGGYDIYARLMARHMGKYIPGNPTMRGHQHAGRRQQRRGRACL